MFRQTFLLILAVASMAPAVASPRPVERFDVSMRTCPIHGGARVWGQAWDSRSYERSLGLYDALIGLTQLENSGQSLERYRHLNTALLRSSINSVQSALRLYGPRRIASSFNGGKDATIVLFLYLACLANYYREHPALPKERPLAVYFAQLDQDFSEAGAFVRTQESSNDVDLRIHVGSYREQIGSCISALQQHDGGDKGGHVAFLLGVRTGDPDSEEVGVFEPSSAWILPAVFMRVHPILNWTYGMVWDFFQYFDLPYCELYNQGYTSLGSVKETRINARLVTSSGVQPARDLDEWQSEREGRDRPPI